MKPESVILLFSGTKPRHAPLLDSAVRAVHDAGLAAVCVAPSKVALTSGEPDAWGVYRPGAGHEGVIEAAHEASGPFHAVRVISLFEDDVRAAAILREQLGVEGLTVEESIYFRDKNAMNVRAEELGLRTAIWTLPHTKNHVRQFAAEHQYPIVIKPYDGVSCTNTYKVTSDEELDRTWPLLQAQRHDYRVEAFIHGKQFHVDTMVRDGEVLFESVGEYTAQILENWQDAPMGSVTHPATGVHREMLDAARTVVTAFGLRTGIAHTEFYLDDEGTLTFGETAARMAGAWVPSMYRHAYGIDLAYDSVRAEVEPGYTPAGDISGCTGASYLWSSATGRIDRITDADSLSALPYVCHVEVNKAPGDVLPPVVGTRGQDLGHVVVTGKSPAEVSENLRDIHTRFSVLT
ncbi:ATP-grasp domain-containing protein [Streptomyces sp. BG9H]|uniref:ATP-grasp domain-containing protein n=1 Tax=Streptomyces anatolicus TaxID=2675858 RepID=A0ABS6YHM6_9ACTN|nr:ATP-grasp domain-containing protein [Streptomyces anatolicus]MBW5420903.1 ATP-grasp domain-containing protein [Streptomyces anatolicus]